MKYVHDILSLPVKSAGIFDAGDLVGYDGAKVTTADAAVLGIAKHPSTEIGQDITVIVVGMAQAAAAGPIAAGQKVVSAAGGGVQPAGGSSVNVLGTALIDAAIGQRVTILLRGAGQAAPNASASFSSLALGATVITIAVPAGAAFNSVSGATFNGAGVTLGGSGTSRSYTSTVPGTLVFTISWTDAGGAARTTTISQDLGLALSFTVSPAAPQVGDTVELQFNVAPDTITALMGSTALALTGSGTAYSFNATAEGVVDITATRSGYTGVSAAITVTAVDALPPALPAGAYAAWGMRTLVEGYTGPLVQVRYYPAAGTFLDVDVPADAEGYVSPAVIEALPAYNGTAWLNRIYDQTGAGRHVTYVGGYGPRIMSNGRALTTPSGRMVSPHYVRTGDYGEVSGFVWPGGDVTVSAAVDTELTGTSVGCYLATANYSDTVGWTMALNMSTNATSQVSAGGALWTLNGRTPGSYGFGVIENFQAVARGLMSVDFQSGASAPLEIAINGVAQTGVENAISGASAAFTSTLTIGNNYVRTISINGSLPEILIYNRVLTAQEKSDLYTNRRRHLFGTDVVVLDAGSHFEGYQYVDTTPANAMRSILSPGMGVLDLAQSGDTITDMVAQAGFSVDLVPAQHQRAVLLTGQWYNSMYTAGMTVSEVLAAAEAYALARKAAGYDAIIFANALQVGSARWGGQYTAANIATLNAALAVAAADPAETWIDGLADWAARPELQTPTNTTYFQADELHLTPAGILIQGEVFAAAVEALA